MVCKNDSFVLLMKMGYLLPTGIQLTILPTKNLGKQKAHPKHCIIIDRIRVMQKIPRKSCRYLLDLSSIISNGKVKGDPVTPPQENKEGGISGLIDRL